MNTNSLMGYTSTPRAKVVALLTLTLFIITSVYNPAFARASVPLATPPLDAIKIPHHIGTIQEAFQSENERAPLVIHIQDAHANYEAQRNMTALLKTLHTQNGIDTICVEGCEGEVNTSLFRAFPLEQAKQQIIDKYVQSGDISAPEQYAMIAEEPVELLGVDHEPKYIENVKTYSAAAQAGDASGEFFSRLDSILTYARTQLLSEELLSFLDQQEAFLNNTIDPLEYTRFLIMLARDYDISLRPFKHFSALVDLEIYQQKINTAALNSETRSLIDHALVPVISSEETDRLALAELDVHGGRISAYEFYAFLRKLCAEHDIDFREYRNINLYVNYLSLVENIDAHKLLKERIAVEARIIKQLAHNTAERELCTLLTHARVLKRLFELKATPEDLQYFRKHKREFTSTAFSRFFVRHGLLRNGVQFPPKNFKIEAHFPTFVTFYRLAEAREEALITKTLRAMRNKKIMTAVLVAGGYHTAGLEKRLQEKGISYLVVAPRLTEIPTENIYDKIMRSYDKYFGVEEGTRGGTVKQLTALFADRPYQKVVFENLTEKIMPDFVKEMYALTAQVMREEDSATVEAQMNAKAQELLQAIIAVDQDVSRIKAGGITLQTLVSVWNAQVKGYDIVFDTMTPEKLGDAKPEYPLGFGAIRIYRSEDVQQAVKENKNLVELEHVLKKLNLVPEQPVFPTGMDDLGYLTYAEKKDLREAVLTFGLSAMPFDGRAFVTQYIDDQVSMEKIKAVILHYGDQLKALAQAGEIIETTAWRADIPAMLTLAIYPHVNSALQDRIIVLLKDVLSIATKNKFTDLSNAITKALAHVKLRDQREILELRPLVIEESTLSKLREYIVLLIDQLEAEEPILDARSVLVALESVLEQEEAAVVFIAAHLHNLPADSKYLVALRDAIAEYNHDLPYEKRLLISAVRYPEAWQRLIISVDNDVFAAYDLITKNRENFRKAKEGERGYATDIISKEDVTDIPTDAMVDLAEMSPAEIEMLFQAYADVKPEHPLAARDLIAGTLLGGAGTRWMRDWASGDPLSEELRKAAGDFVQYLGLKAAAPIGQGVPSLLATAGGSRGLAQGVVFMTSDANSAEAIAFVEAVQDMALGNEAPAAIMRNIAFVQPITPRRIPTIDMLDEFDAREQKVSSLDKPNAHAVRTHSLRHAGEIVLDDEGRPVFGPENHFDFLKYFFTKGLFLKLVADHMIEGEVVDVFMRVGNQDNFGGAVGTGRPAELSQQILLNQAQSKQGLYSVIEKLEHVRSTLDTDGWNAYMQADEFKNTVRSVIGAVIEGGSTPGYLTGGGIAGLIHADGSITTGVAERGNSALGDDAFEAQITNSNTITYSVLALALAVGLLPSDIKEMIETVSREGQLRSEQQGMISTGLQRLQEASVPVRFQVKLGTGNFAVVGAERDIHGPLGRAFNSYVVVGESRDTYREKVRALDLQLLKREITWEEHQRQEAAVAMNISFLPGKEFIDVTLRKRPTSVLARISGYATEEQAPRMRSLQEVLQELQAVGRFDTAVMAKAFLDALVGEGYYLTDDDLPLVKQFIGDKKQTSDPNQGKQLGKKEIPLDKVTAELEKAQLEDYRIEPQKIKDYLANRSIIGALEQIGVEPRDLWQTIKSMTLKAAVMEDEDLPVIVLEDKYNSYVAHIDIDTGELIVPKILLERMRKEKPELLRVLLFREAVKLHVTRKRKAELILRGENEKKAEKHALKDAEENAELVEQVLVMNALDYFIEDQVKAYLEKTLIFWQAQEKANELIEKAREAGEDQEYKRAYDILHSTLNKRVVRGVLKSYGVNLVELQKMVQQLQARLVQDPDNDTPTLVYTDDDNFRIIHATHGMTSDPEVETAPSLYYAKLARYYHINIKANRQALELKLLEGLMRIYVIRSHLKDLIARGMAFEQAEDRAIAEASKEAIKVVEKVRIQLDYADHEAYFKEIIRDHKAAIEMTQAILGGKTTFTDYIREKGIDEGIARQQLLSRIQVMDLNQAGLQGQQEVYAAVAKQDHVAEALRESIEKKADGFSENITLLDKHKSILIDEIGEDAYIASITELDRIERQIEHTRGMLTAYDLLTVSVVYGFIRGEYIYEPMDELRDKIDQLRAKRDVLMRPSTTPSASTPSSQAPDTAQIQVKPSTHFAKGYEPVNPKDIAQGIATKATLYTAAILTRLGLRGKARGLSAKIPAEKKRIDLVKTEADGVAKHIFEKVLEEEPVILFVTVSEGFGRDEVTESFKSNDVVVPRSLFGEIDQIREAIEAGAKTYRATSGVEYTLEGITPEEYEAIQYQMEFAIIDVIEGTAQFVTNANDKSVEELVDEYLGPGATSIMVTGDGVRSVGNNPDVYADSIFTTVPAEERQAFIDNPLDPEATAVNPAIIEKYLQRIAEANNIALNQIEVVLMDRTRERQRLAVLEDLAKKYEGLKLQQIKDGTVGHTSEATLGKLPGEGIKHKVIITVGGSPEVFFNLVKAGGLYREEGALASVRVYSKNVNKTEDGKDAFDLRRRYAFTTVDGFIDILVTEVSKKVASVDSERLRHILEAYLVDDTDDFTMNFDMLKNVEKRATTEEFEDATVEELLSELAAIGVEESLFLNIFKSKTEKFEQYNIRKLRPEDWRDILQGKKLFTQEDVEGDVRGAIAFITHSGVSQKEGAKVEEDGSYTVNVLRFARLNGKPSAWYDEVTISPEDLDRYTPDEYKSETFTNFTKAKGYVPSEMVQEALEHAHSDPEGKVKDITQQATDAILDLLYQPKYGNEIIKAIKNERIDIQDVLTKSLPQLQFFLAQDPHNETPTLVKIDDDNYQVAHVDVTKKRVDIAYQLEEPFQQHQLMYAFFMLRELLVFHKAPEFVRIDGISNEEATDEANKVVERIEKNIARILSNNPAALDIFIDAIVVGNDIEEEVLVPAVELDAAAVTDRLTEIEQYGRMFFAQVTRQAEIIAELNEIILNVNLPDAVRVTARRTLAEVERITLENELYAEKQRQLNTLLLSNAHELAEAIRVSTEQPIDRMGWLLQLASIQGFSQADRDKFSARFSKVLATIESEPLEDIQIKEFMPRVRHRYDETVALEKRINDHITELLERTRMYWSEEIRRASITALREIELASVTEPQRMRILERLYFLAEDVDETIATKARQAATTLKSQIDFMVREGMLIQEQEQADDNAEEIIGAYRSDLLTHDKVKAFLRNLFPLRDSLSIAQRIETITFLERLKNEESDDQVRFAVDVVLTHFKGEEKVVPAKADIPIPVPPAVDEVERIKITVDTTYPGIDEHIADALAKPGVFQRMFVDLNEAIQRQAVSDSINLLERIIWFVERAPKQYATQGNFDLFKTVLQNMRSLSPFHWRNIDTYVKKLAELFNRNGFELGETEAEILQFLATKTDIQDDVFEQSNAGLVPYFDGWDLHNMQFWAAHLSEKEKQTEMSKVKNGLKDILAAEAVTVITIIEDENMSDEVIEMSELTAYVPKRFTIRIHPVNTDFVALLNTLMGQVETARKQGISATENAQLLKRIKEEIVAPLMEQAQEFLRVVEHWRKEKKRILANYLKARNQAEMFIAQAQELNIDVQNALRLLEYAHRYAMQEFYLEAQLPVYRAIVDLLAQLQAHDNGQSWADLSNAFNFDTEKIYDDDDRLNPALAGITRRLHVYNPYTLDLSDLDLVELQLLLKAFTPYDQIMQDRYKEAYRKQLDREGKLVREGKWIIMLPHQYRGEWSLVQIKQKIQNQEYVVRSAAFIQDREEEVDKIFLDGKIVITHETKEADDIAELQKALDEQNERKYAVFHKNEAYGAPCIHTDEKSRDKEGTLNMPVAETDHDYVKTAKPRTQALYQNREHKVREQMEFLMNVPLVRIDSSMGGFKPQRLFISLDNLESAIASAYFFRSQFQLPTAQDELEPSVMVYTPRRNKAPDHTIDDMDKWKYLSTDQAVAYCSGMYYNGEVKKAFLTMGNSFVLNEYNWLGLHAGARIVTIQNKETDEVRRINIICFGLSGSGKTTYVGHSLDIEDSIRGEHQEWEIVAEETGLLNDDMVWLVTSDTQIGDTVYKEGTIIGTERNVYAIIYQLKESEQREIFQATFNSSLALVENLRNVRDEDDLNRPDLEYYSNGRGTIARDLLKPISGFTTVGLDEEGTQLMMVFLSPIINENILEPFTQAPLSLILEPMSAALLWLTGPSVHTAASLKPGEERRIGEPTFQDRYGPFTWGRARHLAQTILEFMQRNQDKVTTVLLNTRAGNTFVEKEVQGKITKVLSRDPHGVSVATDAKILNRLIRHALRLKTLEFTDHPAINGRVPVMPDVDADYICMPGASEAQCFVPLTKFAKDIAAYAKGRYPRLPQEIQEAFLPEVKEGDEFVKGGQSAYEKIEKIKRTFPLLAEDIGSLNISFLTTLAALYDALEKGQQQRYNLGIGLVWIDLVASPEELVTRPYFEAFKVLLAKIARLSEKDRLSVLSDFAWRKLMQIFVLYVDHLFDGSPGKAVAELDTKSLALINELGVADSALAKAIARDQRTAEMTVMLDVQDALHETGATIPQRLDIDLGTEEAVDHLQRRLLLEQWQATLSEDDRIWEMNRVKEFLREKVYYFKQVGQQPLETIQARTFSIVEHGRYNIGEIQPMRRHTSDKNPLRIGVNPKETDFIALIYRAEAMLKELVETQDYRHENNEFYLNRVRKEIQIYEERAKHDLAELRGEDDKFVKGGWALGATERWMNAILIERSRAWIAGGVNQTRVEPDLTTIIGIIRDSCVKELMLYSENALRVIHTVRERMPEQAARLAQALADYACIKEPLDDHLLARSSVVVNENIAHRAIASAFFVDKADTFLRDEFNIKRYTRDAFISDFDKFIQRDNLYFFSRNRRAKLQKAVYAQLHIIVTQGVQPVNPDDKKMMKQLRQIIGTAVSNAMHEYERYERILERLTIEHLDDLTFTCTVDGNCEFLYPGVSTEQSIANRWWYENETQVIHITPKQEILTFNTEKDFLIISMADGGEIIGGDSLQDEITALQPLIERAKEELMIKETTYKNVLLWLSPSFAKVMIDGVRVGDFIKELVTKEMWKELDDRFYKINSFGTAGVRGTLAIGSALFNKINLGIGVEAHARYIGEQYENVGKQMGKEKAVILGYDSRRGSYNPETEGPGFLVQYAAGIYAAHGIKVYLFDTVAPTPELSFAISELADIKPLAGGVFTASHNPATDSGFKPYDLHGGQVVHAGVQTIANGIIDFAEVQEMDYGEAVSRGLIQIVGKEIDTEYIEKENQNAIWVDNQGHFLPEKIDATLKVVFSSLNGTAQRLVPGVLARRGFDVDNYLCMVDEQSYPDGDFPTCPKPNPEEKPALDLATEIALRQNADILIATDPDSDRIGVGIHLVDEEKKLYEDDEAVKDGYYLLSGNQQLVVLTDYILSQLIERDGHLPKNSVVGKTLVSSPLMNVMVNAYQAQDHDISIFEPHVGFKFFGEKLAWYAEIALDKAHTQGEYVGRQYSDLSRKERLYILSKYALAFIFGGEESYGSLVGDYVKDKDAITVTAMFVEIAGFYKKKGLTITQRLEEIYSEYGFSREETVAKSYEGAAGSDVIDAIMADFRANPLKEIAGKQVIAAIDYKIETKKGVDVDEIQFPREAVNPQTGKVIFTDAEPIDTKAHTGYITIAGVEVPLFWHIDYKRIGQRAKLGNANVLMYVLEDGSKIIVRPSGTEPKIKYYILALGSQDKDIRGTLEDKAAVNEFFQAAKAEIEARGERIAAPILGVADDLEHEKEVPQVVDEQQVLERLSSVDFEGTLRKMYGVTKEEAEQIDPQLAKVGFDGDKNRLGWSAAHLQWIAEHPETQYQVTVDGINIRKQSVTDTIFKDRFKYVIFCGMGGSGLSVQVVKTIFGEPDTKIYSLRTTDPGAIKDILSEISALEGSLEAALHKTLIMPISKFGTTQETVSHKQYFEELYRIVGIDIKEHMWVITDDGSPFDTKEYPQRNIQLNAKGDIGGRFTAPSTNIFLLPLAIVAPERVDSILKKALEMNDSADIQQDVFLRLAAFLFAQAQQGRDKLTLFVSDELRDFAIWFELLLEESLGKDGKGITLFYGEDLTPTAIRDLAENDRVFLNIALDGGTNGNVEMLEFLKFLKREVNAGAEYPYFELNLTDVNEIGGLMLGMQRAVAAIGYLWDIVFVDQPAVEGYKRETRKVMEALQPGEQVRVPEHWQYSEQGTVQFYYTPLIEAGAFTEDELRRVVTEVLNADMSQAAAVYAAILILLEQRGTVEAIELMSYGKMSKLLQNILQKARTKIFTYGLRLPSKLGEGPDKNHSFHQNIAAGKDMWFSTYFMPREFEQPEILDYDDNLIKAQTIGTVQSLINDGRNVALIVADDSVRGRLDIRVFMDRVYTFLVQALGGKIQDHVMLANLNDYIAVLAERPKDVSLSQTSDNLRGVLDTLSDDAVIPTDVMQALTRALRRVARRPGDDTIKEGELIPSFYVRRRATALLTELSENWVETEAGFSRQPSDVTTPVVEEVPRTTAIDIIYSDDDPQYVYHKLNEYLRKKAPGIGADLIMLEVMPNELLRLIGLGPDSEQWLTFWLDQLVRSIIISGEVGSISLEKEILLPFDAKRLVTLITAIIGLTLSEEQQQELFEAGTRVEDIVAAIMVNLESPEIHDQPVEADASIILSEIREIVARLLSKRLPAHVENDIIALRDSVMKNDFEEGIEAALFEDMQVKLNKIADPEQWLELGWDPPRRAQEIARSFSMLLTEKWWEQPVPDGPYFKKELPPVKDIAPEVVADLEDSFKGSKSPDHDDLSRVQQWLEGKIGEQLPDFRVTFVRDDHKLLPGQFKLAAVKHDAVDTIVYISESFISLTGKLLDLLGDLTNEMWHEAITYARARYDHFHTPEQLLLDRMVNPLAWAYILSQLRILGDASLTGVSIEPRKLEEKVFTFLREDSIIESEITLAALLANGEQGRLFRALVNTVVDNIKRMHTARHDQQAPRPLPVSDEPGRDALVSDVIDTDEDEVVTVTIGLDREQGSELAQLADPITIRTLRTDLWQALKNPGLLVWRIRHVLPQKKIEDVNIISAADEDALLPIRKLVIFFEDRTKIVITADPDVRISIRAQTIEEGTRLSDVVRHVLDIDKGVREAKTIDARNAEKKFLTDELPRILAAHPIEHPLFRKGLQHDITVAERSTVDPKRDVELQLVNGGVSTGKVMWQIKHNPSLAPGVLLAGVARLFVDYQHTEAVKAIETMQQKILLLEQVPLPTASIEDLEESKHGAISAGTEAEKMWQDFEQQKLHEYAQMVSVGIHALKDITANQYAEIKKKEFMEFQALFGSEEHAQDIANKLWEYIHGVSDESQSNHLFVMNGPRGVVSDEDYILDRYISEKNPLSLVYPRILMYDGIYLALLAAIDPTLSLAKEYLYHALHCEGGDKHRRLIETKQQALFADNRDYTPRIARQVSNAFGIEITAGAFKQAGKKGWLGIINRLYINSQFVRQQLESLPAQFTRVGAKKQLLRDVILASIIKDPDDPQRWEDIKAFAKMLVEHAGVDKKNRDMIERLLYNAATFHETLRKLRDETIVPTGGRAALVTDDNTLNSLTSHEQIEHFKQAHMIDCYEKIIVALRAGRYSEGEREMFKIEASKRLGRDADDIILVEIALESPETVTDYNFLEENISLDSFDFVNILIHSTSVISWFDKAVESAYSNVHDSQVHNKRRVIFGDLDQAVPLSYVLTKIKELYDDNGQFTLDAQHWLGLYLWDVDLVDDVRQDGAFDANAIKESIGENMNAKIRQAKMQKVIGQFA